MNCVPEGYEEKVFLVRGSLSDVVKEINSKGCHELYIDGGVTIQNFLKEDLIDEMTITTIPVLLGGGSSLFGDLATPLNFTLINSTTFLDTIVQNHFKRDR